MSPIWESVKHLFDRDDGSLPEIAFQVRDLSMLVVAYAKIQSMASGLESRSPYYWSKTKEREVSIAFGGNPAEALVTGDAEPFHVVFYGIRSPRGLLLPSLGSYWFVDEIALDYRIGEGWSEESVMGLFELIDVLAAILETRTFEHRENQYDSRNELLHHWSRWRSSAAP